MLKLSLMKRVIKKFSSFKEAAQAEEQYYTGLSSEEKLKILIGLIGHKDPKNGIIERRIRVYSLTESEES